MTRSRANQDSFGDSFASFEKPVLPTTSSALLTGNGGANILTGTSGADQILGLGGNDVIEGKGGPDIMDGGSGNDTLSYASSIGGVNVNLGTLIASGGDATGDVILSFENLTGGYGNDTLVGTSGDNIIMGGAGNDIIMGGAGADTLSGGDGIDTLYYATDTTGVVVSLSLNTATGGDAQGDNIGTSFENVGGGSGADNLAGNTGDNVLAGGSGNDILFGNAGNDSLAGGNGSDNIQGHLGADIMDGGAGIDTLSYNLDKTGVTVNMETGAASRGHAAGDVFANFENLLGGSGADVLTGNSAANTIGGQGGIDTINGGGGDDRIEGGSGGDTLTGGAGNDTFVFMVGFGNDLVTDFVGGSGANDVLEFNTTLFTDLADLMASAVQVGSDTVITFDSGNTVTLDNVSRASLVADDFRFVA